MFPWETVPISGPRDVLRSATGGFDGSPGSSSVSLVYTVMTVDFTADPLSIPRSCRRKGM